MPPIPITGPAVPEPPAAVDVPDDDHDLYSVTESGWYTVDDEDEIVLGPFDSLAQCDRAIRNRLQEQKA